LEEKSQATTLRVSEVEQSKLSSEAYGHVLRFAFSQRLKINLECSPKHKLLYQCLCDLDSQYQQFASDSNQYTVWVHASSEAQVTEVQEFLHSAFLRRSKDGRVYLLEGLSRWLLSVECSAARAKQIERLLFAARAQ